MAENVEVAKPKREKLGNVYCENIDGRVDGGRRVGSKPELQPYRPGCGLLPKSPRSEVKEVSGPGASDGNKKGADTMDNIHRGPPLLSMPPSSNGAAAAGGGGGGGGVGGGRRPTGKGRSGRGEGRHDRGEGRHDRGEGRNDRGEGRNDRGEGRNDRGEGRNDRGEGRSDRGDGRSDRGDGRSDRGDGRSDRMEGRNDRVDGRNDRGNGRNDRGDGRNDRGEGRHDRGDGRNDRASLPKEIPVSKVAERLKQIQLGQNRSNNSMGELVQSEPASVQPQPLNDPSKRSKKPDQPIYVSKPIAQSMAFKPRKSKMKRKKGPGAGDNAKPEDRSGDSGPHPRGGNAEMGRPSPSCTPHSYDSRGAGQEGDMRYQEDSNVSHSRNWSSNGSQSRNVRLSSEPRSLPPPNQNWDYPRTRDTRSVEPSGWNSEKVQAKPPSGRRGSGKDMPYNSSNSNKPPRPFSNTEIPPRFKRMMENGMVKERSANLERSVPADRQIPPERQAPIPLDRQIPPERQGPVPLDRPLVPSEELWDGTTKMFSRGGFASDHYSMRHHHYYQQQQQQQQQQQYHSMTSVSLPPTPFYTNVPECHNQQYPQSNCSQEQYSNTLPAMRARGRGRLRPEEYEKLANTGRPSRAGTPDQHSVSSSVENLSHVPGVNVQKDWQARAAVPIAKSPSPQPQSPQPPPPPAVSPLMRHPSVGSCNEEPTSPAEPAEANMRTSVSPVAVLNVPEITDWSEEVELSERLEMGVSDNLPRSPINPAPANDTPAAKRSSSSRKPKKKKKDKRPVDDSFGGEHPFGRGHGRDLHLSRGPEHDSQNRWHGDPNDGAWQERERDRERNRNRDRDRDRERERACDRDRPREVDREDMEGDRDRVWRRDQSRDRDRRDVSHERADRGRSRRNSYEHMPPPAPPPPRREASPERDRERDREERGGRHRRNSGREHSGDRFRQRARRNSIREHSADRTDRPDRADRDWPRHRRNSGRDNSRDRRDHSRDGGGRRERMGHEWRRGRGGAVPDDDWRRPTAQTSGAPPLVHAEPAGDDWRRGLEPPKPATTSPNGPKTQQTPGLLVLPTNNQQDRNSTSPFGGRDRERDRDRDRERDRERDRAPPLQQQSQQPAAHLPHHNQSDPGVPPRHLYDPNNHKLVRVISPGSRAAATNGGNTGEEWWGVNHIPPNYHPAQMHVAGPPTPVASLIADQFGNTRPRWYDPYSEGFRASTQPHLILDIEKADLELQWILSKGMLLEKWPIVENIRKFLESGLRTLVLSDVHFCHKENADLHLWKILFYNLIEVLRNGMGEGKPQAEHCRQLLIVVIDQGMEYLENLLADLEETYKIQVDDYVWATGSPVNNSTINNVLIVAQKLYLFLGNLARYREQACETSNFFKARQWYIKAQQLNPKSGRPYNQLAILAMYARRKLDAVYYYMRGLMASSYVVHTARERLISIFDENRKKYEQAIRKRREDRAARRRETEDPAVAAAAASARSGQRREVWVRPGDGQRDQRTTAPSPDREPGHSEEEELAALSSAEVNKRFLMSYLHIHGKLFTKVGMETFTESAVLMLREFRALLQHSPVPLSSTRFLQLLALNMAAIDNTQLKNSGQLGPGIRSVAQESALRVSLQMFGLVLERCVALLREQLTTVGTSAPLPLLVSEDILVLLPAIKAWCDWLVCHSNVWNPPPCLSDYQVGPPGGGDVWAHLAALVTLLEQLDSTLVQFSSAPEKGMVQVRLPEDSTLAGFTPLMANPQKPCHAPQDCDLDLAQVCLRIQRLLFFGTAYLCGIDPPVLKLHKDERGRSEYVSVVASAPPAASRSGSRSGSRFGSPTGSASRSPSGSASDPYESLSDDDTASASVSASVSASASLPSQPQALPNDTNSLPPTDAETRTLLHRKEELERRRHKQEKQRQRVQAIIRESQNVVVEMEVRPHFLVADTNCFVDYLSQLKQLAQVQIYALRVPLVVVNELEGLARGGRKPAEADCFSAEHAARVAQCAKDALDFLRQKLPTVRCVTTKGTVLTSTVFTSEEEGDHHVKNDDKILTTCVNLCRTADQDQIKPGEPRRLVRDVVLLTEDRNLRVKALARDVPVRELPDFFHWANLS